MRQRVDGYQGLSYVGLHRANVGIMEKKMATTNYFVFAAPFSNWV